MMSTFLQKLKETQVDNLQKITQNGRQKYVCFTKAHETNNSWMIQVTDGIDVWLTELDEDGMEAQKDLNGITSTDAFLTRFKNGFQDSSVGKVGNKITLNIGKGGASLIEMDLYEAKAAEKKAELSSLLFRLVENCSQLQKDLTSTTEELTKLKAHKVAGGGLSALMDLSPKKGHGPSKPKTSKVGMSVVNPSSRKRKTASGVVFGD